METISKGICLYETPAKAVRDKMFLAAEFGCKHLQFRGQAINCIRELLDQAFEIFGFSPEASIYVDKDSMEIQGVPYTDFLGLAKLALPRECRFLVLGADLLFSGKNFFSELLNSISCKELIQSPFICLELPNTKNHSLATSWQEIFPQKDFSFPNFNICLNTHFLAPLPFDAGTRKILYEKSLMASYSYSNDKDGQLLKSILPALYMIPFKDRPFIITDHSLDDIYASFEIFRLSCEEESLNYL